MNISNEIGLLLFELYESFFSSQDKEERFYNEFDLVERYEDDFPMEGWDIGIRVTYLSENEDNFLISYYADGNPLNEKELQELYYYLLNKKNK